MALLFSRTFVPILALAVGSWVGLGKPPVSEMGAMARPRVDEALHAASVYVPRVEAAFEVIRRAIAGKNDGRAPATPAPQKVEAPFQTVDASQLPDPAAMPRLNAEVSMRRAWLLAEGPARQVDVAHRLVTLTLDDGPFPETTPAALKLLARYNVRATFFFIGRYLDGDEPRAVATRAIAREVAAAGHYVGNHTHDHHLLTLDSKSQALAQIDSGAASIERAIGRRPNLFRPPYGQLDAFDESVLKQRRNELVLWNIEVGDMKRHDVEGMFESLRVQLDHAGGGIVLLHDIRKPSVQVLAKLLEWLDQHKYDASKPDEPGYEIVDLVTYMKATAAAPQPYADRAGLEKARSEAWVKVKPKHKAPPPMTPTEGHDAPVL